MAGTGFFLVEPANAQQLAEKLRFLINHPEARGRMGRNSRKLAEEEFEWRKIAARYLAVYEGIA